MMKPSLRRCTDSAQSRPSAGSPREARPPSFPPPRGGRGARHPDPAPRPRAAARPSPPPLPGWRPQREFTAGRG